jgi:hypothetical protein
MVREINPLQDRKKRENNETKCAENGCGRDANVKMDVC